MAGTRGRLRSTLIGLNELLPERKFVEVGRDELSRADVIAVGRLATNVEFRGNERFCQRVEDKLKMVGDHRNPDRAGKTGRNDRRGLSKVRGRHTLTRTENTCRKDPRRTSRSRGPEDPS